MQRGAGGSSAMSRRSGRSCTVGLLCVLDFNGCVALGEDGGRDSTWTDVRAPLGRLPVTMVDELVAEGG